MDLLYTLRPLRRPLGVRLYELAAGNRQSEVIPDRANTFHICSRTPLNRLFFADRDGARPEDLRSSAWPHAQGITNGTHHRTETEDERIQILTRSHTPPLLPHLARN